MADPDPLEELASYLATAPPAVRRLARVLAEILRPPPPAGQRGTLH
jgi:hypothetical protein